MHAALHDVFEWKVGFRSPDRLLCGAGCDQDLRRENEALAVGPREQALRDDAAKVVGETLPSFLHVRATEGEDTTHGARYVRGVQRRQNEVAGFGGLHRDIHRFFVADLPDEDDIRVLAQGGSEGGSEVGAVDADFPLRNRREVVGVDELDRIFDGDDVDTPRGIEVSDHRGEGRALPVPGGTDHENETTLDLGERLHDRREPQLVEARNAKRDCPHRQGEGASLAVDVDPVAADLGHAVRGVVLLEFVHRSLVVAAPQHDLGEGSGLRRLELLPLEVVEVAVDTECRRLADLKENVACVVLLPFL